MPTPQARHCALQHFAEDFERGAYWDAHEQLETLWRVDRLELWQALIQLAATFVLLSSGRPGGARSVLSRAQAKLVALPESLHGVDVAWVRRQCGLLNARLAEDEALDPVKASKLFGMLRQGLGVVETPR